MTNYLKKLLLSIRTLFIDFLSPKSVHEILFLCWPCHVLFLKLWIKSSLLSPGNAGKEEKKWLCKRLIQKKLAFTLNLAEIKQNFVNLAFLYFQRTSSNASKVLSAFVACSYQWSRTLFCSFFYLLFEEVTFFSV